MGNPAQVIMDIRKYLAIGKGSLYPRMIRFSTEMQWEDIGYKAWIGKKDENNGVIRKR
jgi:hypothetical protein